MDNSKGNSQNAIRSQYEWITYDQVVAVASIDSKTLSDATNFVESNRFQYYVATNSWLLLIHEILGERSAYSVKNTILREGLVKTIAQAADVADSLVQYVQGTADVLVPTSWFIPSIKDINLGDALQALRYLKRFTPTNASILEDTSFQKLLDVNNRCKVGGYIDPPEHIACRVRAILSSILEKFPKYYKTAVPSFSSGSTTRGKLLYQKLRAYSQERKYWIDPMYPIGSPFDEAWGGTRFDVTIKAVPKNYKGYRLIAPEHPYYAAEKQRIMHAIRDTVSHTRYKKQYDPEKQVINQEAAFQGSISGEYATIDLTSASDTISEMMAYNLFPASFLEVVYDYRVPRFKIRDRVYRKYIFATSGDPICFDCESLLFLAIAQAVTDMCSELTGDRYHIPTVYGDDIIVDNRIFDTMLEWLQKLRFIPNASKSFGSGGYRESCGVEYYYGYDVSTKYWPRAVIRDIRTDLTSLQSLTALQHRVFGWWRVSAFLTDVITWCIPSITASEAGADCDDLWADSPYAVRRCAPYAKESHPLYVGKHPMLPEWTLRECHTTLTSQFPSCGGKEDANVEMMLYVDFLRNGPTYGSPLDELLGISTARRRDAFFAEPTAKLRVAPQ